MKSSTTDTMLFRFRQYPEFWILLAITLVSLPLLRVLTAGAEGIASVLTLALFILPGSAVVALIGPRGAWIERLALAFVASLAILGIAAQIAIFAHTNIAAYTWSFALVTAILVAAALVRNIRSKPYAAAETVKETGSIPIWLVLGAVGLAAVILFFQLNSHMDSDQFDNLGWIQSILHDPHIFVVEPRFASMPVSPRFLFSAWFVQQAMMSFVSGVDPVNLVGPQQLPLILLTLAAMYYLARRVTGRKDIAVWVVVLWELYLLLWNEGGTFAGYEVIVRASLDKVIGGFIILPVGLGLVLEYFNQPRRTALLWLIFSAIAATLTHPITGALFGLSLAGFAIFEFAVRRDRRAFVQILLVTLVLMISLVSSFYLLVFEIKNPAQGLVATSLTDTRDPSLYLEISGAFDHERIFMVGDGYILHPRLLLQWAHIPAFLALPLLFRRGKKSRPARLLFGMLVVIPLVLAFPPTAMLLGTLVTPSLLYRLHWPLSIAAVIADGWLAWELLERWAPQRRTALATASLAAVVLVGIPQIKWNFTWLHELQTSVDRNFCVVAKPLLQPFQTILTGTSIVLGDSDVTDFCLVAYAPNAKVVEFHGTNGIRTFIYGGRTDEGWQRLFDAEYYHNAEFVDSRLLGILKQWNVSYVVVSLDSPLEPQLAHLSGNFQPLYTAVGRRVFRVISTDATSPVVQANSALTNGQWSSAQDAYKSILGQGSSDDKYLAAIGLGRAYFQTGDIDNAIGAWRQAASLSSEAQPNALLGEAYTLKHDAASALQAYQRAVTLPPSNQVFQVRLGDMYQAAGDLDSAEKAYDAAAAKTTVPGTSVYYAMVGQFWSNVGVTDRAFGAYNQSNSVFQVGSTYQAIGTVQESSQRWSDAEQSYRKMIWLDPWDWNAHTSLAELYATTNQPARAIGEYLTSLRLEPLTFAPYQGLADTWTNQQGQPAAITQMQQLTGYRLGFGPARSALSTLYTQTGKYDQAVTEARRASLWYRLGTSYYDAEANALIHAGRNSDANTPARRALELDSSNVSGYLTLAQTALAQGKLASATGFMLRSIIADPYGTRPQIVLAGLLQQQDQAAQALATYQSATRVAYGRSDAWTALGQYQFEQGKLDQAAQSYQTSLTLQPDSGAAQRGKAQVQQNQGKVAQATDTLQEAVRQQPGDAVSRQALGDILIQQGKIDEGIAQLKQATQLMPSAVAAFTDLGDMDARLGHLQDAQSVYQQLASNVPTVADGYLGLAGLYERRANFGDARASYTQALNSVPEVQSGAAQVAFGNFEARQGAFDQAIAHFQAAIARQPLLDSGYIALARIHLARGDYASANQAVRQGLKLVPGSASLLGTLAAVQAAQGDPNDAEKTYRHALDISPLDSAALQSLAQLYASTGHLDAALAQVSQAYQIAPGNPQIALVQINFWIASGQPSEAQRAATALSTIAAGKANTWIAFGQAMANQGQPAQALDAYKKATQLEPGTAEAWVAYVQYLVDQGKVEDARAALSQGLEAYSGSVELHLLRAELLTREGQAQDAVAEYQLAAKLDSTRDAAWLEESKLDQQMGKLPAAVQDSTQAAAAAPTDPEAYRTQASVFSQQGQLEQARQSLIKGTTTAPGSCDAFRNLGDYLASRGDMANAESSLQKSLGLAGCTSSPRVSLGNMYAAQAKPDAAIDQYRQAVAANPGDPFASAVLANMLTMQLRWNEANSTLDAATARTPGSDLLLLARGRSLIAQGKLQDGLDAMKKATDLHAGIATDWIARGNAAQVLNQMDVALASYKQAVAVDKSSPDAAIALGDLYSRQAQNDAAKSAYQQAVNSAPGYARTYNSLGAFLESLNQNDGATSAFRQGVNADKGGIESLLYLAREYQRLGMVPEAQQTFQQATSIGGTGNTVNVGPVEFSEALSAPSIAQAYIGLGNLARSQADSAAEQDYKRAIQLAPADANGYISLGNAYLAQGRKAEAQAQFQAATRVNPISAQAYVALGDLYSADSDQVSAQQAYLKAIGVSPANAIGYISLGRSYQVQGQKDQAAAQLATAANAAPASAPVYVALGDMNRAQANWAAAEQAYLKALQKSPRDPSTYIGLGKTYQAQLKWDQAIAQFQQASQLDPASAQGALALGALYRQRADWSSAENAYKQATATEPTNPSGSIGLGETYLAEGQASKAGAAFLAGTVGAPGSAQAYSALGDFYRLQLDWKSAELAYQQATKVEALNPLGYIGLGETYQAEGLSSKALEQYQAAVKNAPLSGQTYRALGDWYQTQADWKNAQQVYQKAIQLEPNLALGYVNLAHVLEMQGHLPEAEAQLKLGIANVPTSSEPYVALGHFYALEANSQAAGQVYAQATQALPMLSSVYVALGDWYQSQGTSANAEQAYKQAISIAPAGEWPTDIVALPDLSAYVQLSSLYQAEGKNPDALQQLKSATTTAPGVGSALVALGNYYVSQADKASAEQADRQALKMEPSNSNAYSSLGLVLGMQGRAADAANLYQTAVRSNPGDDQLLKAKGDNELARGQIVTATLTYQQALKINPSNLDVSAALARAYAWQGLYSQAEKTIADATASVPGSPQPYVMSGDYDAARQNWDAALAAYREALKRAPGDSNALQGIVKVNLVASRPTVAVAEAAQWAKNVPEGDSLPWLAVGVSDRAAGDLLGSESAFQKMISNWSGNIDGYLGLAQTQMAQGQFQDAARTLERAYVFTPGSIQLYLEHGLALEALGKMNGAQDDYRQAMLLDASQAGPYLALANVMTAQGHQDQAIELMRQAAGADPTNIESYIILNGNYLSLEQNQQAVDLMQGALPSLRVAYFTPPIDPIITANTALHEPQLQDGLQARLALAEDHAATQDLGGALKILSDTMALYPKDQATVLSQMALVSSNANDIAAAHKYYQQAQAVDPGHVAAFLGEGELYLDKQQDFSNAINLFEQAARIDNHVVETYQMILRAYSAQRFGKPTLLVNCSAIPVGVPCGPSGPGDYVFHTAVDSSLEQEFLALYQANPDSVGENIRMAMFYEAFTQYSQAISYWQRASKLDPTLGEAYLHLSRLYARQETGRLDANRNLGMSLAWQSDLQEAHNRLFTLNRNGLSSMQAGDTVRGAILLNGTADSDSLGQQSGFAFYKIEIGAGTAPTVWSQLTLSKNPVTNGVLGIWDTTSIPNGTYSLRLTVVDTTGNYGPWQQFAVQVKN